VVWFPIQFGDFWLKKFSNCAPVFKFMHPNICCWCVDATCLLSWFIFCWYCLHLSFCVFLSRLLICARKSVVYSPSKDLLFSSAAACSQWSLSYRWLISGWMDVCRQTFSNCCSSYVFVQFLTKVDKCSMCPYGKTVKQVFKILLYFFWWICQISNWDLVCWAA